MPTSGLGRALVRWWWLTLLGLLITGGLAGAAGVLVAPTYLYRTDVLLVPPAGALGANPYLSLGGLREVAEVLSNSLSDDATAESVEALGAEAKFSVDRDATQAAPFVLIVAEDKNAADALKTSKAVLALVAPRLAELQRSLSVPTDALITSKVISTDDKPTVVRRSQVRAIIAAAAFGLFLTVAVVSAVERLSGRRGKRQSKPKGIPGDAASDEPSTAHEARHGDQENGPEAPAKDSRRRPRLASSARRAHERATH